LKTPGLLHLLLRRDVFALAATVFDRDDR